MSSSAAIGILAAGAVFFFKKFTGGWLADKPLYIFAIHTGGGAVGMILTGAFARLVRIMLILKDLC